MTDIGTTADGLVFLVMEYLDGENLEERLRRVRRLAAVRAVNIIGQVARGLGAAHELGIVHRDLKPANIFLVSREGRRRVVRRFADETGVRFEVAPEGNYDAVKLLDFGVAKFLDLGPSAATRAGAIFGTPYYLSPEQAQEKPADVRSDIYSSGRRLLRDDHRRRPVLRQIHSGDPERPRERHHRPAQPARARCRNRRAYRCGGAEDAWPRTLRNASPAPTTLPTLSAIAWATAPFFETRNRLPGIQESGLDLSQSIPSAQPGPAAGPADVLPEGWASRRRPASGRTETSWHT